VCVCVFAVCPGGMARLSCVCVCVGGGNVIEIPGRCLDDVSASNQ